MDIEPNVLSTHSKMDAFKNWSSTVAERAKKPVAVLVVAAISHVALSGCGERTLPAGPSTQGTISAPHELPPNAGGSEESTPAPSYPPEVEEFIKTYPSHYEDNPASSYYALVEQELTTPSVVILIDDAYFDTYTYPDYSIGEIGDLLIDRPVYNYELDLSEPANYQSVLNDFIPRLNLLMNQLSKNPGELRQDIILNEFKNWCTSQKQEPDQFMEDILRFVNENGGSSSNFTILPAAEGKGDPYLSDNTSSSVILENTLQVDSVSDLGLQVASAQVSFIVEVDKFDDTGAFTQETKRIDNSRVHLTRAESPSASTSEITNFSIG